MILFIGFDDIKSWYASDYNISSEYIDVFNWDGFDLSDIQYLMHWNSKNLQHRNYFYKIEIVEMDEDRNYLKLKILNEEKDFDLKSYKRDLRIEKLINI